MWKRAWTVLVVAALGAGILAALAAAQGPPPGAPGLERALAAQERATDVLLARSGVVGTAVTLADGKPAVAILADRPGLTGLPRSLDGVQVVVRVTGPISALHHRPGHGGGGGGTSPPPPPPPPPPPSPTDPKQRFPRPVPIGVSTGHEAECSAGTIGARVRSGSTVYALSNNHVYARENQAAIGSRVLQPGRLDSNCVFDPNNVLGNLSAFVRITFSTSASNRVDGAIAVTDTARLGTSTPSNGYGTPQSATTGAFVGQSVQKYGRTTGQTFGTVTMVNATVNVGYSSGTARFVDQIIVESNQTFIQAGDSGSLLVSSNRNPVGLLYAGSQNGRMGVANRIGDVLSAFGVTVDGS